MANKLKPYAIKAGMGGSRAGRGRSEKTAVMKAHSKKLRRRLAQADIDAVWTFGDWCEWVSQSHGWDDSA